MSYGFITASETKPSIHGRKDLLDILSDHLLPRWPLNLNLFLGNMFVKCAQWVGDGREPDLPSSREGSACHRSRVGWDKLPADVPLARANANALWVERAG